MRVPVAVVGVPVDRGDPVSEQTVPDLPRLADGDTDKPRLAAPNCGSACGFLLTCQSRSAT
jgi:hypothetical protein